MAVQKLTNIGRLKLSGDYKTDIALLVKNLSKMENHIYDNLVPAAQVTTIINTNISASTTISVRWIKQTLSAGVAATVIFTPAFTSIPSVPPLRCYNSAGLGVGYEMGAIGLSGFTVTPQEDCYLDCVAIGV